MRGILLACLRGVGERGAMTLDPTRGSPVALHAARQAPRERSLGRGRHDRPAGPASTPWSTGASTDLDGPADEATPTDRPSAPEKVQLAPEEAQRGAVPGAHPAHPQQEAPGEQRELGEAANNLSEQQREISKTLGDTGESIRAAATDTSRQMQESVDQIAGKISESLTQAQSAITQTTESVANRMDDAARKHFEAVYQSIEQSGGNMRTLMETQFENFGKGIQESIESIVQELGEGLTRISRELVRDISELRDVTQALKSQREQERNDL